jgi:hypothetical protein
MLDPTKIQLPTFQIKLKSSDNYEEWLRAIKLWLRFNSITGYVDGSIVRPTRHETRSTSVDNDQSNWDTINNKTIAGILHTLDEGPNLKVEHMDTAKSIWDKLTKDYEPRGTSVFVSIFKELRRCHLKDFANVQEFGDKLRNLKAKADRIDPDTAIADGWLKLYFLENLTSAFDQWVTSVYSNYDLLDPTKKLRFDELVKMASEFEGESAIRNNAESSAFLAPNQKSQQRKRRHWCPGCQKEVYHSIPDCRTLQRQDNQRSGGDDQRSEGDNPRKRRRQTNSDTRTANQSSSLQASVDNLDGYSFLFPEDIVTSDRYSLAFSQGLNSDEFYLDSGADKHLCCRREYFVDLDSSHKGMMGSWTKKGRGRIEGLGTINMPILLPTGPQTITLKNALFVPAADCNLIALSGLHDNGLRLHWSDDALKFKISRGNCVVAMGKRKSGTGRYIFDTRPLNQPNSFISHKLPRHPAAQLWHQRLAHLGIDNLKRLQGMADGIDLHGKIDQPLCDVCVKGKAVAKAHSHHLPKATRPMMRIHSDMCGPIEPTGLNGERYILTFKDDHTKLVHVDCLKSRDKDPVLQAFLRFRARFENKGHGPILYWHSDGGGEYVNHALREEFNRTGIEFEMTCTNSPEQNGMAEGLNRILLARARSVIHGKNLPHHLWPEIVSAVVYITNRCPVNGLNVTPYEAFYGTRPNLSNIRILGCTAWVREPNKPKKLDSRSRPCLLVGFEGTSIYRLYDPSYVSKIRRSNDVDFDEEPTLKRPADDAWEQFGATKRVRWRPMGEDGDGAASEPESAPEEDSNTTVASTRPRKQAPATREDEDTIIVGAEPNPAPEEDDDTIVVNTSRTDMAIEQPQIGLLSPLEYHCLLSQMSSPFASADPPQTYRQAMTTSEAAEWHAAAIVELDAHRRMGTWDLVEPPAGAHVLKGRWVFRVKTGPNGEAVKHKARWCVRGDRQIAGIDYEEVFSSVVKSMTYKLQLNRAAVEDLEVEQMDFETAFLNSKLQEVVYIEQPEGFNDGTGRVCILRRALYGLKQAPRAWYQTLAKFLQEELNMRCCRSDISVFIDNDLQISVYVDDILIFGKDKQKVQRLKDKLSARFNMKDLGPVTWYLGIKITRDRQARTITLSQKAYFQKVLERFQMADCNPVKTPMKPSAQRPEKNAQEVSKEFTTRYQQIIGSLMYGMLCTRPELAFSSGLGSRFSSCPSKAHGRMINNILAYIKGSLDYGLVLGGHSDIRPLQGFTDAAFKDCPSSSKSTSGYVFFAGSGAISWSSKLQSVIATSSTHSEFIGQFNATKEALFLRGLAEELWPAVVQTPTQISNDDGQPEITMPATVIKGDNNGALSIAKATQRHAKTKHFDPLIVRYCQEQQQAKHVSFQRVDTEDNLADIFTKPLEPARFAKLRSSLGVHQIDEKSA